jgi:uncharacterized protein YkwD
MFTKKNKAAPFLTLTVFLLVFLLPVHYADAFGATIIRDRFQVVPSTNELPGGSSGYNEPALPSPKPELGQTESKTPVTSYLPIERTSRRSGGVYVPPATSPAPSTIPSNPSLPPSIPVDPPPSAQDPAASEAPSWLTADEAKAYALLNDFRIKNNLPPLQANYNLTRVARMKAQDIIDNNYFAHLSPTYGSIGQMLRNEGVPFTRAGENLSKAGNVSQAHLQLEYSTQGHRENMLSSGYNNVGIGILKLQKTPGIIMVQLFTD